MNKKIQLIAIAGLSISSLLAFSYEYKVDEEYYIQNESSEWNYFTNEKDSSLNVIDFNNYPFDEERIREIYSYPNGCLGDGNKNINKGEN